MVSTAHPRSGRARFTFTFRLCADTLRTYLSMAYVAIVRFPSSYRPYRTPGGHTVCVTLSIRIKNQEHGIPVLR
jgi:hypothetical protein